MARITSEVVRFDLRSRTTGKRQILVQRTSFRIDRIDGHCVRAPLQTELRGECGRMFQKVAGGVRCVDNGELFAVLGVAPKTPSG